MEQNGETYHILINKFSGTVLRLGEDDVRSRIENALEGCIASLDFIAPDALAASIAAGAGAGAGAGESGRRNVLIGGGDGSAVAAADHAIEMAGTESFRFGILPLGTMNLLAQDLGAAPTFEETMARLKGFREDRIDYATAANHVFLCSAVIGLVPESAIAREEIRSNVSLAALTRFIGTVARGMAGQEMQDLTLHLPERAAPVQLETTSLIISNNRFTDTPQDSSARFARDSLTDGTLAVYSAAPKDVLESLQLLGQMVTGTWQDNENVLSFDTPSLTVATDGGKVLVSLDGEPMELQSPIDFKIHAKSLPVLRMELTPA